MLEIKYRSLEEITPSEINPRDITEKDFEILCESLVNNPEFFEARPILLSDRTGKLMIIAGHQRYAGAKKKLMKQAPTILIPGLTEAKEKEIMLRDNVNNGTFNLEMLEKEFSSIPFKKIGLNIPQIKIQKRNEAGADSAATGIYQEEDIKPFNKTHILLSIPLDKFIEVAPLLEQIKAIKGIDYEQASN